MAIVVDCPSCGRQLRVPDELLGRQVKCPSCDTIFLASEDAGPVLPAAAPEVVLEELPEEAPARRRVSSRRRRAELDDEDEEDGDRPRRRRRRWEDDDDADDRPTRRRAADRPGKVQAIAIMMLVGGIFATLEGAALAVSCYGLIWPGTYYSLAAGIMAITEGSKLLGRDAHWRPPPKLIAILLIVNIINLNIADCIMGILCLVFLNEPEVQEYYQG